MAPATAGTGPQLNDEPLNEFEAERARIIARNRQKMEEMGVLEAAGKMHSTMLPHFGKSKYINAKKRLKPVETAMSDAPARVSRRLRGLTVDNTAAATDTASATNRSTNSPARSGSSPSAPTSRKQPAFELLPNVQYTAPFTLASVGVTVWDLGELHRGPWQQHYWSSKGCKYHHAYPVGYAASKVVFNRTWRMTITAGERGPIFTVCDESGRFNFTGTSPTKPWTDVCLAHRTGQRISGPQYYGFSDILLQRAITTMYTPHELECVQYNNPLRSMTSQTSARDSTQQQLTTVLHNLTPAEQFACDLECSIKGIGATTAAVIATTTALGGAQHTSLGAFRAWLTANNTHVEQLIHFLLNSAEMPQGSRYLPSWRNKWVPLIVQQLINS